MRRRHNCTTTGRHSLCFVATTTPPPAVTAFALSPPLRHHKYSASRTHLCFVRRIHLCSPILRRLVLRSTRPPKHPSRTHPYCIWRIHLCSPILRRLVLHLTRPPTHPSRTHLCFSGAFACAVSSGADLFFSWL
ncbi:MAG: hypothetical protein K8963_01080 [Proteobacteria bacterium]|nr:hypothetical protein [Pseudomonadota bacterium]